MKNKKLFSSGLYKEMLRQLSVAGVIGFAIALIIAISPVMTTTADGSVAIKGMADICSNVKIVCDIIAPVMAFIAFGYGNKRKTSDFFHAVPYTRECVYISNYLAVMTWISIIAVVSTGVSVLSYSVFPTEFVVMYAQIPMALIRILVSSMVAVSAVSLAAALTGTALMNILVSLMILIVPGAFVSTFVDGVLSNAHLLSTDHLGVPTPQTHNLYFGSFGHLSGFSTYGGVYPIIYTLCIAILYGVLACICFKKRKSEISHVPSASSLWQSVFRIVFIVPFMFFPLNDAMNNGVDSSHVLWWLFCLVGYFAFEIITTKKWKNLVKAIPGFFIAIGICVLSCVMVIAVSNKANKFSPTAEEIDSVRIVSSETRGGYYYYYDTETDLFGYATNNASKVKLTDERVKEIIASSIEETLEKYKGYRDFVDGHENMMVAVRSGAREYYRWIWISSEKYEELISLLAENEEYRTAFMAYPEVRLGVGYDYSNYTHEGKIVEPTLLETLEREISEVDFVDWYDYLHDSISFNYEVVLITKEGVNSAAVSVPLKAQMLPDSFYLAKSKGLDNQFNRDSCVDILKQIERAKNGDTSDMVYESRFYEISVQACVQTPDGAESFDKSWCGISYILLENELDEFFDEDFEILSKMIFEVKDKPLDLNSFVEVSFSTTDQYKNYDGVDTAYFSIPEEYVEFFMSWDDEAEHLMYTDIEVPS